MDFEARLQDFIIGVNKVIAEAKLFHPTQVRIRTKNAKYLALDNVEFDRDDVEMQGPGKRTSIYCFIATQDTQTRSLGNVKKGDVLKPATWKQPAKHARGNIFDEHNGLRGADGKTPIQWTGPHYC